MQPVLALLVGLHALAASQTAAAQDIDPTRYAQVKAGYILNFVRLTQWPEEAFEDEQSPIVITIVGHDSMRPFLADLLRDERVHDRRIILRRLDYPQPGPRGYDIEPEMVEQFERAVRTAHVLFIARDHLPRHREILRAVESSPVLTVSDIPRFAERGGMLGLAVRDGHVAIDAHSRRIREADVVVSSRLLRLARIVDEQERTPR